MENRLTFYFGDNFLTDDLESFIDKVERNEMIIFLHKDCTTVISDKDLDYILKKIDKLLEKYDLFYLSSLLDSCSQKFDIIEEINGLKIISSHSPNGFYGLAGKRDSWKRILSLIDEDNYLIS